MARANTRLASRFYQLKAGHGLTGQYLHWTMRRPGGSYWWCQYKFQTRKHIFKNCPKWKCVQKALWATNQDAPGPGPGEELDHDRGAARR